MLIGDHIFCIGIIYERKRNSDRIRRQMRCLQSIIFTSDIIGDIKTVFLLVWQWNTNILSHHLYRDNMYNCKDSKKKSELFKEEFGLNKIWEILHSQDNVLMRQLPYNQQLYQLTKHNWKSSWSGDRKVDPFIHLILNFHNNSLCS